MGWDLGVCEIRNVSERHMGNCATYDVLLFSYFHFFFWFQTYGVMVKVENGSDPLRCFFLHHVECAIRVQLCTAFFVCFLQKPTLVIYLGLDSPNLTNWAQ